MNYIELLRVPKANWNNNVYLYNNPNLNGITYANNAYLIGTFKGTGNYMYPFKSIVDKGTRRADYTKIMPFDDTRYCFAFVNSGVVNTGYVKTYKYVWEDDTPNYNDLWNYTLGDSLLTSSTYTKSYVYYLSENTYNLILNPAIKTDTVDKGLWLVRMNGGSYVSNKMMLDTTVIDPAYYPPDCEGYYWTDQTNDRYYLAVHTKDDNVIKKIHYQIATDSNFSNIIEEVFENIIFLGFTKVSNIYLIREYPIGHQDYYARARMEDSSGNGGDWSRTVLWRTQDSDDATFEEWTFTGHIYTYTVLSNPVGFYPITSGMVGTIQEDDNYYVNGTWISEAINYYFYVFDTNGNFIQRKLIGLSVSSNSLHCSSENNKFYICYYANPGIEFLIYDADTNTYSDDFISYPDGYVFTYYPILCKRKVYYIAYLSGGAGNDIFYYDSSSKTSTKMDLPNNKNYPMLSQSFQDDGFWFDFDDGTYCGIAFYRRLLFAMGYF